MKTKIHSLFIFALSAFAINAHAQCTITSGPTVTPNGLSISVTGTGTGGSFPVYGYDWGDATGPGSTQTATHTYAAAGTYHLCMYYFDGAAPTTCLDSSCMDITVSISGIVEAARPLMEIKAMPNPFTTATIIQVTLTQSEKVNIAVFDITGQQVATIYDGTMDSGQHTINWKPEGMANGMYFLQIYAGDKMQARKIIFDSNGN